MLLNERLHALYGPLIFVELLTRLTVALRVSAATRMRRRRFGRDAPRTLLLPAHRDRRRRHKHSARQAGRPGEQQHAFVLVQLAEQFANAGVLLGVESLELGDRRLSLTHQLLQRFHRQPRCDVEQYSPSAQCTRAANYARCVHVALNS